MLWRNKTIRYLWLTLAFYSVLVLSSNWLEHESPSGPCTPGGGIMLLLLAPLLIIPIFLTSLVLVMKGHRWHLGPVLIHGLVLVVSLAMGLFPNSL